MLDYGEAEDESRIQPTDAAQGQEGATWDLNPHLAPQEVFASDDEDEEMEDDSELTEEERLRRRQEKEARRKEKEARARGARFYALPVEESVRAGANRGVSPLNDDELEGGQEGENDVAPPEMPRPIGGILDLRYSVLHMAGPPITQCSTSRLFSYVTHFGAQPLGLEWVNDQACNVVFANADAARLAIEYLCPATAMNAAPLVPLPTPDDLQRAQDAKLEHDRGNQVPGEPDQMLLESLLISRKAHRFPAKLYTGPERDTAMDLRSYRLAQQKAEQEDANEEEEPSALPADVPEIYREMEREDRMRQRKRQRGLSVPTAKLKDFEKLESLRGTLWIRWCIESLDVKSSGAARQSKWYRDHGLDAGRDVVAKPLVIGAASERPELFPGARVRRSDEERKRAAMDAELDDFGRQRQQRRDRLDPLDEVEEEGSGRMQWSRDRSRSLSPDARRRARRDDRADGTSGSVRVRGRGAMRAPRTSGWGNDEDDDAFHYAFVERGEEPVGSQGDLGGRMMSDRLDNSYYGGGGGDRNGGGGGGRRRRRGRGGGGERRYQDDYYGDREERSLKDRIQPDDRSLASRLS